MSSGRGRWPCDAGPRELRLDGGAVRRDAGPLRRGRRPDLSERAARVVPAGGRGRSRSHKSVGRASQRCRCPAARASRRQARARGDVVGRRSPRGRPGPRPTHVGPSVVAAVIGTASARRVDPVEVADGVAVVFPLLFEDRAEARDHRLGVLGRPGVPPCRGRVLRGHGGEEVTQRPSGSSARRWARPGKRRSSSASTKGATSTPFTISDASPPSSQGASISAPSTITARNTAPERSDLTKPCAAQVCVDEVRWDVVGSGGGRHGGSSGSGSRDRCWSRTGSAPLRPVGVAWRT